MTQHLDKDSVYLVIEQTRKNNSNNTSNPFPSCTATQIQLIYDCCARQELGYHETYDSIAANIIYHVTKGHYLEKGNKRIATSLFLFYSHSVLSMSEYDLSLFDSKCIENNLKKLILKVADSKSENQKIMVKEIEKEVRKIWSGFTYRD